jgi:hypothetical protein
MMEKILLKALKNILKQHCEEMGYQQNDVLAKKVFSVKGLAYSKTINNKNCALIIIPGNTARTHVFYPYLAWCPRQENFENISPCDETRLDNISASGYMAADEILDKASESDYRTEADGLSLWNFSTKSDRLNDEYIKKEVAAGGKVSDEETSIFVKQWAELLEIEKNDYDGAVAELKPVVDKMFAYINKYVTPFFNKISGEP